MSAADFAALREVGTGSWLGLEYHRQGIGTAMRAAVLALAFDGLGAEFATSSAFSGNLASVGVSRRLGYTDDGLARHLIRGKPVVDQRFRLDGRPGSRTGGSKSALAALSRVCHCSA